MRRKLACTCTRVFARFPLKKWDQPAGERLAHHSVAGGIQMPIPPEERVLASLSGAAKRRQSLDVQDLLTLEPGDKLLLDGVEA